MQLAKGLRWAGAPMNIEGGGAMCPTSCGDDLQNVKPSNVDLQQLLCCPSRNFAGPFACGVRPAIAKLAAEPPDREQTST